MTATKTKPDGWVDKEWRDKREEYRDSWEIVLFDHEPEFHPETTMPICLVPPALLDWVGEVEKELQVQSFDWCRHLLNKLKEVQG